MRSRLSAASSSASLLLVAYLSRTAMAQSGLQRQSPFTNATVSWAGASPLLSSFVKRTTCSGTCAECYGDGSILCGDSDSCYNPTIGESCCSQYSYACSDGYYCAPDGLDSQCCANTVSTSDCTAAIEGGGSGAGGSGDSGSGDGGSGSSGNGDGNGSGGSGNSSGNGSSKSGSSGLSTGAKIGIGIGAALLIVSITSLIIAIVLRSRRRKRTVVPAGPAAWQMPNLSNGQGGPGVAETGYNNAPQAGYGGPQAAYDPPQGGYAAPIGGGYAGAPGNYPNTQGGGYPAPPQGGYGSLPQGGYNGGYDNGPQGTYNSNINAYNSPQVTYNETQPPYASNTYPNTIPSDTKSPAFTSTSGGPPVADVYTPAPDGAQKAGYGAFVPSRHAELAETPPVHGAYPTQQPTNYAAPSEMERAGTAEMYGGGYGGQGH